MKYVMCAAMVVASGLGVVASGQQSPQAQQHLANRDKLRIAAQQICPVSGKKLGSMGAPIKATVGKAQEEVFLCCKSCLQRQINPQHWATIHANIAQAQQICPVMKHKLPKDAKSTIVQGQIVYVCCPPCTKKIAANPDEYLRKIDQLYQTSLQSRRASR